MKCIESKSIVYLEESAKVSRDNMGRIEHGKKRDASRVLVEYLVLPLPTSTNP